LFNPVRRIFADGKNVCKFSFGNGEVDPSFIRVLPVTSYSKEVGYGLEPGAELKSLDTDSQQSLSGITSDKPFYFSVTLPEGDYKVTATLGGGPTESDMVVKAELRRLMLEGVKTAPGVVETRIFNINLRTPEITGGGSVKLKPREKTQEIWDWDDKLTLEFNGKHPTIRSLIIEPAPHIPTIYILGDSTVCDQPDEPWNSWGQMLPRFFKSGIAVSNQAESGESLRSSLSAKRLDKVVSTIKPGDYLFIQFGHNDMKEKGDGVGAFTTYKADLKKFVAAAQQKGATSVLVTSMHRKKWDPAHPNKIINTLGDYPEAVRQAAREENVPLIDLNAMSKDFYEALGPANIDKAFQDGTHHNNYGSYELAKCIINGIKENHLDLAKFILDDVPNFDPKHPDSPESFTMPASPAHDATKPLGD
jgi:lysophospholipase L1-like esterase